MPFKEEEKESPDDMLEDKGHGGITMKTYFRYFIAGSGYVLGCIVLLLFLVSQVQNSLLITYVCMFLQSHHVHLYAIVTVVPVGVPHSGKFLRG